MRLATLADAELVFPDLPAKTTSDVLRAFAERIVAADKWSDADTLYQALWERELLCSTGVGGGVALPHCKLDKLDGVLLAVGHTRVPIDVGAVDNQPAQLFFTVVSPRSEPAAHLQCLAAISRWITTDGRINSLLAAHDPAELFALLTR